MKTALTKSIKFYLCDGWTTASAQCGQISTAFFLWVKQRWSAVEKKKMDVGIPHVFQNCNKGMDGMDQADQSISLYRTAVRGKK